MLRVLFIGLGSIGKRHLRILSEITDLEALRFVSGKGGQTGAGQKIGQVKDFFSFEHAIKARPDFAIISNPTFLHISTGIALAKAGVPFIIEKPVSNTLESLDELTNLVSKKKIPVMVGFQMRYHPGFCKLVEIINSGGIGRPLFLQGYVGQYLPDWRPNVDYRKTYSAQKEMGGGVILDLSHEIDIAMAIMGAAHTVSCTCERYSDLEIDSEDMAQITIQHEGRKVSSIHLNYIERGYEWWTQVIGTYGTVRWNYAGGYTLLKGPEGKEKRFDDPSGFSRDDLFRTQFKHWFKVMKRRALPIVSLKQGIAVTKVCCAAEQSALEGKNIRL